MSAVAVLTPEQIGDIVRGAVRAELAIQRADEREILTREQAAELLQIHPDVLVRYVRTAGLPATKLGAAWRFRRSDLVRWLADRAVQPGAPTARLGVKLKGIR